MSAVSAESFERVAPLARSNEYPLHVVERHFLRPPVVKLRRAC
jgi:hypothetical protein